MVLCALNLVANVSVKVVKVVRVVQVVTVVKVVAQTRSMMRIALTLSHL